MFEHSGKKSQKMGAPTVGGGWYGMRRASQLLRCGLNLRFLVETKMAMKNKHKLLS